LFPEPPPPAEPWYEALDLTAFADAYGSVNYRFPKPQTNANALRAYDHHAGFALAWVGADVSYEPAPVGGKLALRFGPSAERHSRFDADHHLENVKEAFASWRPGGHDGFVTLDFGKFDTIYGIERSDSQANANYTRGLLFWLVQPRFHTGLRGTLQLGERLAVKLLAVNGVDRSVDNNIGKSFGAQLVYTPTHRFNARVGWLGGPEQDDTLAVHCPIGETYSPRLGVCAPAVTESTDPNVSAESMVDRGGANDFESWRHLVDAVITFAPSERLELFLNGDLAWERRRFEFEGAFSGPAVVEQRDVLWYGVLLGARYELTEQLALAGRAEYVGDPDGLILPESNMGLASGTLTLEVRPRENLILRLEQRGDFAVGGSSIARDVFPHALRERSSEQLTTTLGVVVTTD
jgi:hypothetical protein